MPRVIGGRYGLSSKEFTPAMVKAVFDELGKDRAARTHFTVGINDDVAHTSLGYDPAFVIEPDDVVRAMFYGLGADGTVGANKNSDQDHRRGAGLLRPGLLRLRFQEVGRADGLASALRAGADPRHLPDPARRTSSPATSSISSSSIDVLGCAAPGRHLPAQQPVRARGGVGPPAARGAARRSSTSACASSSSTPTRWRSDGGMGGRINTVHADLLLRHLRRAAARTRPSRRSRSRSRRPTARRARRSCARTSRRSTTRWRSCTRSRSRTSRRTAIRAAAAGAGRGAGVRAQGHRR